MIGYLEFRHDISLDVINNDNNSNNNNGKLYLLLPTNGRTKPNKKAFDTSKDSIQNVKYLAF